MDCSQINFDTYPRYRLCPCLRFGDNLIYDIGRLSLILYTLVILIHLTILLSYILSVMLLFGIVGYDSSIPGSELVFVLALYFQLKDLK